MEYKNEFFNKNIIITGASSGIGLSSAFYFLNNNANVILVCQDVDSMKNICIKNNFRQAIIIKADLEKEKEIKYLLSNVIKIFRTIDILINCAGIKFDNDIEKTFSNDFDYTLNVNLRSVFVLLKELRPYFSLNASIINISCIYGTRPMYGVISYSMSKAGLETLTRYAAADFSNLNIRVNAISACPVNTNSLRYIKVSENEINYFNKKMEKYIPLGRIAEADDIVKVIIFLASKRSSKITGQIIKVDGGRSLTSSGYVHYKGIDNMNISIEPDSVNFKNYMGNDNVKIKLLEKPINDKNILKKFIDETITQSNFSTRNREAHLNIIGSYYKVKENDSTLTNKFLKGNAPNELLIDKKEFFKSINNDFNIKQEFNYNEEKKQMENKDNNI